MLINIIPQMLSIDHNLYTKPWIFKKVNAANFDSDWKKVNLHNTSVMVWEMNFQFLFQAHLQKHTQSCSRCWDDIWTLKTQWKSLQRWRGCICGRQFKDTWLFLLEKKESFLRRLVGCYGYLSKALRIMAHPTSDVRAVDVCVKREGAKPVARIIKCTASTPEALQPVEGSDGVGTLNSALNFPPPSRVKSNEQSQLQMNYGKCFQLMRAVCFLCFLQFGFVSVVGV